MNKKIKILVIPSDRTGVSFFRSTKPHISLEENHPEFSVDIVYATDINFNNLDFFDKYDIIHYHKTIVNYEHMEKFVEELRKKGIVTIMDIDDHWCPGPHHPAHQIIKANKLDIKLRDNLKHPDYVMTTTEIFADEIRKYNKNVVVVPNAIDPKDRQFRPNPEKSDRVRIGWLGGSCYDDKTEVLTDEGWKFFKDLTKNEKVVTLNPTSNIIEYQLPNNYIEKPYKGKLNVGKSDLIDYAVTPNHNMYVSKIKNLGHKKLNYDLIPSKDVHNSDLHFKRDGIWNGGNIVEKYLIRDTNGDVDVTFEINDWLKIFGFWLADGWTSNSKNSYQVGICQFKDNDYLKHLNSLMIKYGYKPYINKEGTQYRYSNKNLWLNLKKFGGSDEKFIPRELLNNLTKEQLELLLEWYIKGDGHIEKGNYDRTRAWTSSKQLSNDLQELALKIGVAATIKNRGKKNGVIEGKIIKSNFDSYQVGFSKHPDISKHNKLNPLLRKENQFDIDYDGLVYCVEVPNHILYVRRNGKAFWCGNSHLYDLQILRGVVNKIKAAGLIDKVQFVLCGFDTRGIMKEQGPDGKITERPIKPEETVWTKYEAIFTDNYSTVSPEYKEHLLKYEKKEFKGIENEPYRRVWTKPVTSYATNYNLFDISLAPIEENNFNRVKSQLKIIEAGFHKKAIICQDFGPYTLDTINSYEKGAGYNENGNALVVDSSKNHKLWFKFIKELVENESLRNKLSENLHNTVKDKFSLVTTAKMRADFYKEILEKK